MNNNKADFFSVLVIGDNPDEIIANFNEELELEEPYMLYQYKDRHIYRKKKIDIYKKLVKTVDDKNMVNMIIDKINELKSMSDEQYYLSLGELHMFDNDKNILTTENPNGKWVTCERGGRFFINKLVMLDGEYTTSTQVKNIDWEKIHFNYEEIKLFGRTWDLCVSKIKPENVGDENIISNMKQFPGYFDNYKNKEHYIKYSTSFFTNAIIINGEWFDMENVDYSDWILNFYDKWIKNLDKNTLITIYECIK